MKAKKKIKAKAPGAEVCACRHRRDEHGLPHGDKAARCLRCKGCLGFRG